MRTSMAFVALSLLALTGCSSSGEAPAATVTVTATPTTTTPIAPPESSAKRIAAENLDPAYLEAVKARWMRGDMPSDKKLISLGKKVCSELKKGNENPQVFPGDLVADYERSINVQAVATETYCPELQG